MVMITTQMDMYTNNDHYILIWEYSIRKDTLVICSTFPEGKKPMKNNEAFPFCTHNKTAVYYPISIK